MATLEEAWSMVGRLDGAIASMPDTLEFGLAKQEAMLFTSALTTQLQQIHQEGDDVGGEISSCEQLLMGNFGVDENGARLICQDPLFANSLDQLLADAGYSFLSSTYYGPWSPGNLPDLVSFGRGGREAALAYALLYFGPNRNDNMYPYFEGTDCTNFASQVLKAGGLRETVDWWISPGGEAGEILSGCGNRFDDGLDLLLWGEDRLEGLGILGSRGTCAPAWSVTPDLHSHLTAERGFGTTELTVNIETDSDGQVITSRDVIMPDGTRIQSGDVAFFDRICQEDDPDCDPNDGYDHAAIIVGWGPPAYVDENGVTRLDFSADPIPWIADHSGGDIIRPINWINNSYSTEVVHIEYPVEQDEESE